MTDPHRRPVNIASMPRRKRQGEGVANAATAGLSFSTRGDATVALPRIGPSGSPLRALRAREALRSPIYGPLALGVIVAATVVLVLYASSVPSTLVQGSYSLFPAWMAGPLHGLLSSLLERQNGTPILAWQTVDYAYTGAIVAMFAAYAVVLACAKSLSMRAIWITVAGLYLLIALGPPLGLTDIFNYLGYARLGALHGFNPYTHVIADERFDPVYLFVTWRNFHSPYGQVFTILTYPLGWLPLSASYWVLKVGIVLVMGALVVLVWKCARQLGYDPRYAVLFVALNPIVLINDIGGFHNDGLMLVPIMAAISLLLAKRYRWAGVALAVAIGVKPTAILVLPFLMLGARADRKSLQVLIGTVLGGIPLAIASVALFGFSLPNVADQSIIVTPLSVVNLVSVGLPLGGASPGVEEATKILLVLVVCGLLVASLTRGRPDWLSGAGWATLALLIFSAWLMPWYLVWVIPLVALSTSRSLHRAFAVFTVFAVITFLPPTAMIAGRLHQTFMNTPADEAASWQLYNFQH